MDVCLIGESSTSVSRWLGFEQGRRRFIPLIGAAADIVLVY
jgi:hypothetical protein